MPSLTHSISKIIIAVKLCFKSDRDAVTQMNKALSVNDELISQLDHRIKKKMSWVSR